MRDRISTGATALVVNRPHKLRADPGAPSRGVLPLLAVEHGAEWIGHVGLGGMASFALLLATPRSVTTWDFDGQELRTTEHPEGTHMLTSGGPENRKADVHLRASSSPPTLTVGAGSCRALPRRRPGRARGPPRAGRSGVRDRLR